MPVDWKSEKVKDQIDEFLDEVLELADLDLDYDFLDGAVKTEMISPDITVDFSGPDVDLLLDNRAELLLALEHLTLEALGVGHQDRYRLIFDAEDYRVDRIEDLRESAEAAAKKVLRTGRPHHFKPMTSRERRILHLALRDIEGVTTESEGEVPRRHTVIYPED